MWLLMGSSESQLFFSRKGRFSYLYHKTLNLLWRLLPKYLHNGLPREGRLAVVLLCAMKCSDDCPPLYSSSLQLKHCLGESYKPSVTQPQNLHNAQLIPVHRTLCH